MTFNTYQILARRTQNESLSHDEQLRHALHGLAAEVGEIHSIFQKKYQGHPIDTDDLISELGDVLWFVSELADCVGTRLGNVAQSNINKLLERYPADEGFSEERSVHRKEYKNA